MIQKIDLRGLNCPEPVLQTKKLFDDSKITTVTALVDDDICVMNLQRLSRSLQASITVKQLQDSFEVTISRKKSNKALVSKVDKVSLVTKRTTRKHKPSPPEKVTVIFLTKDKIGDGDKEFSQTLVNLFLQTILEAGHLPKAILMLNSGVKLISSDSPCLKVLNEFKERGSSVLACGLCLEYYGLKEQIAKDQITNMFAICEYLFSADKIISP